MVQTRECLTVWTLNRFSRTGVTIELLTFLIKRFFIPKSPMGRSGDSKTITGGYSDSFSCWAVFKLPNLTPVWLRPLSNFNWFGYWKQTPFAVYSSSLCCSLTSSEVLSFRIDFGAEHVPTCTESSVSSFSFSGAFGAGLFCSFLLSSESSPVLDEIPANLVEKVPWG